MEAAASVARTLRGGEGEGSSTASKTSDLFLKDLRDRENDGGPIGVDDEVFYVFAELRLPKNTKKLWQVLVRELHESFLMFSKLMFPLILLIYRQVGMFDPSVSRELEQGLCCCQCCSKLK